MISNDRRNVPVVALTQDDMCVMAAALRSSISLAAGGFKRDGLITCSRGKVEISDRPGLEGRACACYRRDKEDLGERLALTLRDARRSVSPPCRDVGAPSERFRPLLSRPT